jgi:hypothetical protein
MNKKHMAFYLLSQVLSLASVGLFLFWSAGRVDYGPAWVALAIYCFLH